MFQEFIKRFDELGCKVNTTELELKNSDIHIRKFKFLITCKCGHDRITNYYDFASKKNHNCLDCNKSKTTNDKRLSYDVIYKNFEDIGCQLITDKEFYNNSKLSLMKFDFEIKAKCGHDRVTKYFTIFENEKSKNLHNCLDVIK